MKLGQSGPMANATAVQFYLKVNQEGISRSDVPIIQQHEFKGVDRNI